MSQTAPPASDLPARAALRLTSPGRAFHQRDTMAPLHPFTPRARPRLLAALVLLTVLLAAASAIVCYLLSERDALAERANLGRQRLAAHAGSLSRDIDRLAFLPATLAVDDEVLALARDAGGPLLRVVNLRLEQLNAVAGTLAIYVMDRHGIVQAASNWARDDSYVGDHLTFRPYYTEAMEGQTGHFLGIGTSRSEPGYYISAPLHWREQTVGVGVVKVSLAQLERSLASLEVPVLVTDENGVVVLSSEPALAFHTLAVPDDLQRRALARSMSYNGRDLPTLALRVERKLGLQGEIVRFDRRLGATKLDGRYLAQSVPLAGTPWTLHVLSPLDDMREDLLTRATLAAFAAIVVCLSFAALHLARQRQLERFAARVALQNAHDELEQRVVERSEALRQVQENLAHAGRLAALGQLAAGLAHELNQPLAALRTLSGNAIRFLERGQSEPVVENLAVIARQVDRMGELTQQLRNFAARSASVPQRVPVTQVIDDTLFLLDHRRRSADIALYRSGDTPDIAVSGDANRLQQVLLNLIGNACDALEGRPHAKLWLTTSRAGATVAIRVRDNGPGLADAVLARMFEPFLTTKDAGRGLGLGLAISVGIVRDCGGRLSGANHPDGGAEFCIELPICPPEATA